MVVIQIVGGTQVRAGQPVVTIGSDPESLVAFPRDLRVAPRHAVIRQVAGRWLIESQGEGLIRVGNGVPTKMGWLTRGDSIKLTDDGPELVFDPPQADFPAPGPANPVERFAPSAEAGPAEVPSRSDSLRIDPIEPERARSSEPPVPLVKHAARREPEESPAGKSAKMPPAATSNRNLMWVLVGGGLLAGGMLLGAFWPGSSGRARSVADGVGESHQAEADDLGEPGDPRAMATSRGGASHKNSDRAVSPGAGPVADRPAAGAEAALYLVIVKNPDGAQVYQLGTAFAVASGRLATSGGVGSGLKSHKAALRTIWARPVAAGNDIEITSIRLHPEYGKAVDDARSAQQAGETLRDKLGKIDADTNQVELSESLIAADERLFAAYERQASFDVALLEIIENRPPKLELAGAGSAAPGTRLSLWGVPFESAGFLVDPEQRATAVQAAASLLLRLQPPGDPALARLVLKCQLPLTGQNWSGGPVLNTAGRVVGVYSRPTPPPFETADRPAPATHDIVEIEKLKELAPELKTGE